MKLNSVIKRITIRDINNYINNVLLLQISTILEGQLVLLIKLLSLLI